jgi:ribosomal-protein-alanine N-acetyltransferase
MKIRINDSFFISDISPNDKPAYVEHLKEKQIYDQTLAIPFPYSESDADWWITNVAETTKKQGRSVNWAIRNNDGFLIGGIGFHDFELGKSHKAELGYWLAKSHWNHGIMTEAIKKVTEFGLNEFGLSRITANVFLFNLGSARALEKAGYQLEGVLRKHYLKDGKIFDGKLYAVVKEEE